jgi:hypothetical protein
MADIKNLSHLWGYVVLVLLVSLSLLFVASY